MGELSSTPYYLTPLAHKAIVEQLQRNLEFWTTCAKHEAQTPVLKAAIDHEIEYLRTHLQHYSSVEF